VPGTNDAKRELRRTMRMVRRQAASDPGRSAAIADRLAAMPVVEGARRVMLYAPLPGEPDLRAFAERLSARGVEVVVPAPDPRAAPPTRAVDVDVVVLPGLAFTRTGSRLGQGGGWYDRFLAGAVERPVTVGVCFDEQIVDHLPVEPHDVPVASVVTPTATFRRPDANDPEVGAPGSSAGS
jgi:5-formyltetrahydrofolate cyclo-ligase